MMGPDTARIEYLGLDRVMRRGTAEILFQDEQALFIRDTVSGACLLACDEEERGLAVLEKCLEADCELLMLPDPRMGQTVTERYGFSENFVCWQLAYYGPAPVTEGRLAVRTAVRDDLPVLLEHYHRISPDELAQVVERRCILLGYEGDRLAGFVGEHLEGSMGLLYVFPEFRRRGYGTELEKLWIGKTLEEGFTPFGQVEKDNTESLRLQERIGLRRSDRLISWLWK